MKEFFYTTLYVPIYNILIFFVDIIPNGDVGIAVILVTIVVQLLLTPLAISAAKTQRRMRFVDPQIKEIREKYKNDREKLALETLAVYKNNGIRPFASIFLTFLRIPVILCLYLVFSHEQLLSPNTSIIYHFVSLPTYISPLFLGVFPTTGHVLVLAILAALVQLLQAYLTIPVPKKEAKEKSTSADEFARMLALQSRVILPVIIGVVAYTAGALALYFITSSVIGIAQEYYVRRKLKGLGVPGGAKNA